MELSLAGAEAISSNDLFRFSSSTYGDLKVMNNNKFLLETDENINQQTFRCAVSLFEGRR